MNAFTAQLLAFPSLPSWNESQEKTGWKRYKLGLSEEKVDLFRQKMEGRGWLLRRDIELLMGMSRPQVNHALTRVLVPLGMVDSEWISVTTKRYRWKLQR